MIPRQRIVTTTREITPDSSETAGFKAVDQLLDSKGPLDEAEQERLIHEFEDLQLRQARLWRTMFGGGALLGAALFSYMAWAHQTDPWGQQYTGELRPVCTHGQVLAILVLQAAALAAAAYGLLLDVPKKGEVQRSCMPAPMQRWLAVVVGTVAAALAAVFWIIKLVAMVQKYGPEHGSRWSLSWLPLAPLVYCGLCQHVLNVLKTNGSQVQALRGLKYSFKKV